MQMANSLKPFAAPEVHSFSQPSDLRLSINRVPGRNGFLGNEEICSRIWKEKTCYYKRFIKNRVCDECCWSKYALAIWCKDTT